MCIFSISVQAHYSFGFDETGEMDGEEFNCCFEAQMKVVKHGNIEGGK